MKSFVKPGRPDLQRLLPTLLAILVVLAFLSFNFLFAANMGGAGWNEVDVLPLARQFVEPSWLPNDWYLNQAGGYRVLFLAIAGRLITLVGFLWTSILGRLICYGLVAAGCVWIAQRLQLRLPFLLLAIGAFILPRRFDWGQGAIAEEWLVGGLEPKALAYGFVLMAIACLLTRRYRGMAALLGVATSFHVLVGGWAALTSLGWLLLKPKVRFPAVAISLQSLAIYILASAVAIPAVLQQLFSSSVESEIPPSHIYAFWRLPHHLNPLSWSWDAWPRFIIYLVFLGLCVVGLKRVQSPEAADAINAQLELAEWALVSLIPFGLGLAIAPLDRTGGLLQYYPFRLADVMLPLATCLLVACRLQQMQPQAWPGVRQGTTWALVGVLCAAQWPVFQEDVLGLSEFPRATLDEGGTWVDMCRWIRNNTPREALFLTPPEEHSEFTWIAERAKIVDYKLFPQTPARILEWHDRLNEVTGNDLSWPDLGDRTASRNDVRLEILESYDRLSTEEVRKILDQYKADYALMLAENQKLNLPVVYQNRRYILYGKP